jgi:inosine-uridine nucleoside N-ribohydrolase
MPKSKVIFDTDAGTDDAWALITLLKCEQRCNIELKAITVLSGNTDVKHGCQNMLLLLKTLDRMDVPVYAGSHNALIVNPDYKPYYHGVDGFKDVFTQDEKPSLDLVQKVHAVEAMRSLIEGNPGEMTIFAVGPLTNIALLYKMHPQVIDKIKAVYCMGGNYQGMGNTTRCAEFNFWFDPEAARIVLGESKCELFILPWEPCFRACFATPHKEWRFGLLNSVRNDITCLMDRIEIDVQFRKSFAPCDAYLVACFAFPKMMTVVNEQHVSVELGGEFTRGQMVIDHKQVCVPNAFVIEDFDVEVFKRVLMWACGHDVGEI